MKIVKYLPMNFVKGPAEENTKITNFEHHFVYEASTNLKLPDKYFQNKCILYVRARSVMDQQN